MSLVADYGSDTDENQSGDENQFYAEKTLETSRKYIQETCPASDEPCKVQQEVNIPNSETDLFSKLPEKKLFHKLKYAEDQIEDFIPTVVSIKDKQKVKITIPSLSDFKSDDIYESGRKKIKLAKNCGLLSLLPPVKTSIKTAKSFVPNTVVNKNKIANSSQQKKMSNKVLQKKIAMKKSKFKNEENLSEDEEFEMPETFDEEMWQKICGKPKLEYTVIEPVKVPQMTVDIAPEPEKLYDGLNNEAFKELVGKTKRPLGNIKLIDINEEDILQDKDISMIKSLTDPEMANKQTCEDPVDPTRKRKHHITYLAQQAKANEQELANAWAASKNSRLASRAKYGF